MRTVFAVLFSLALAAPSPEFPHHQQQQPLHAIKNSLPSTSRWRTLSNHLIDTILHFGKSKNDRPLCSSIKPVQTPPSHAYARYGGDLVLRFNISTSEEAASLAEAADTLLLDVWEFSHDWVDIRLAKDVVPSLLGLLPQTLQKSHRPLLREQELVQAIHDTYPTPRGPISIPHPHHPATSQPLPTSNRGFSHSLEPVNTADTNIFFADYQPLSVIEPWLRLLSSLFTTHVRHFNIGLTYEGRPIPAIRVGVHPTNNEDPDPPTRKTILITGGLHAREWIGTSTVNYVAYSLITGYGKLQSITKLLQEVDFVFIPTLNPDGYVYSWETDRLWRKNRQQNSIRFCPGIDLDHAFDFAWQASGNPCSESYPGETAFEAVEARRLADWARNETQHNNVEFVAFLDLHSYSQEILYPYSYSCRATPPGLENLEELAVGLSKAIRISHGRTYEILPACEGNVMPAIAGDNGAKHPPHLRPRMEASGGSLLDFFYGTMHVRYSYQLKLRDRGTYGFLLPKENIIPTGKEVLNAVIYLAAFLGDLNADEMSGVQLTKPDLTEEENDVEGEEVEDEEMEDDAVRMETVSAPTADILDEVEEESEPGWVHIADEFDAIGVKWDLPRRRRR